MYCSFYSRSYDKPFRSDRFVPRCKMHEIQMLGVIDHDLTTLSLPLLEPEVARPVTGQDKSGNVTPRPISDANETQARRIAHDHFDDQIFSNGEVPIRNSLYPRELFSPGISTPAHSVNMDASRGTSEKGTVTPKPVITNRPGYVKEVRETPTWQADDAAQASHQATKGVHQVQTPVKGQPLADGSATAYNPPSTTSTMTGFSTPKAIGRMASQNFEPVTTTGTSIVSVSPRVDKTPRSLTSKISRSTLSSISGLFRGLSSRPNPTTPITTVESIATTTRSSSSGKPVVLEINSMTLHDVEGMPKLKTKDQQSQHHRPIDVLSRQNKRLTPSTGTGQLAMSGESHPFGTSQVEPVAIPIKGRQTDRRTSRRRSLNLDAASLQDKPKITATDRHNAPTRANERERPSEEGLVQAAYSLPSQRGGSSFPYGNSYKRSYMSSINPCRPGTRSIEKASKARRWQHALPRPTFTQDVKWDSLCAPACLPLTSDMVPKEEELKSQYHEQLYVFDCQANQLSFLLRPPSSGQQWDLPIEVLREMASQRLSRKSNANAIGLACRRLI